MTYFKPFTPLFALVLCLGLSACDQSGEEEQARGDEQTHQRAEQTSADNSADRTGNAENPPPLDQVSGENIEISLVPIVPGGQEPVDQESEAAKAAKGDPQAIEMGRQLYTAFNCVGCHFDGGGGIGPPLMDNDWIYGSSMENIASSIREGRPGGMPAFRALVQGDTVYKLAAYVKSLSEETRPVSEVKQAEPVNISDEEADRNVRGEIKSQEETEQ